MALREKIRSVILTEDNEFRSRSVTMLNNIAFAADKHVARTATEAAMMIENDQAVGNVIFDASSSMHATALMANATLKNLLKGRKDTFVLIYVPAAGGTAIETSDWSKMINVSIQPLPIDRKHFMEMFHTRRQRSSPKNPLVAVKVDETVKIAAQDAAQHLKGVVDHVNTIAGDAGRIDLLSEVGQRYNGIMGTFQFFPNAAGAKELAELGTYVDSLTRTYEKGPANAELSASHLELLITCFKCTLPLIRTLALGDSIADDVKRQLAWARNAFDRDNTLKKREGLKQAQIDQALTKRESAKEEMQRVCVEASAHVKSAIEQLNIVFKDHTRLDAMEAVGQRFNGFFGTFAFFKGRAGADELIELGSVIDDLCRSYRDNTQKGAAPAVADEHVKLLRDSAETCLFLLKDLREGKQPNADFKPKVTAIVAAARADQRIKSRQSFDQDGIDSLLDELMGQAAA
jgi:hypothetical protein